MDTNKTIEKAPYVSRLMTLEEKNPAFNVKYSNVPPPMVRIPTV